MKTIVTGGAGFIGSNAASRYLNRGRHVVIVDNFARVGVQNYLDWLQGQGSLEFVQLDIQGLDELAACWWATKLLTKKRPAPPDWPSAFTS
jgi:CDP-paratose 2-epimerase